MKTNVRKLCTWLTAALIVVAAVVASVSMAARNRAAREAQLVGRVEQLLDEARQAEENEDWVEALIVSQRAADLATKSESRADLRPRIEQLLDDLQLAQRLETGRIHQTSWLHDGDFAHDLIDRYYASAFQQSGIDVEALSVEQAAERIRARPGIAAALMAALDDWALYRTRNQDAEGATSLTKIARNADPDPWRQQVRAALVNQDGQALDELAASESVRRLRPATLVLLGAALQIGGESNRSIDVLRQAQQFYPDDFWINLALADALRSSAPPQWDEAIVCYRRAIDLQPNFAPAHGHLGIALCEKGELEEAIASFREAIRLRPTLADMHNNLGNALVKKGEMDEAIACFREAVQRDPGFALAHFNLGTALRMQREWDESVASLRRAIELAPERVAAHLQLGMALQANGLVNDAITSYRRVIQLQPQNALAYFHIGNAILEGGNLNGAITSFQRAVKLDPEFAAAQLQLGMALEARGAVVEAIPHYRRAAELAPANVAALARLAAALEGNGKSEEVPAIYSTIVELEPENVAARIKKAKALALAGRFLEAGKVVNKLSDADLLADPKDARKTLDVLANWSGGGHRWQETDDYLATLVYGSPTGGYLDETFAENTLYELAYAPLLIELGERERYEALRDSMLSRHGSTTNSVLAERTLMVSLLLPADDLQMGVVANLGAVTGRGLAARIERIVPGRVDPHMYRWACTVLALCEYRRGNYQESVNWGQKCVNLGAFPAVTERVRVVMAMDYVKLNQLDNAKAQLAECQEHITEMHQGIIDARIYEAAGYRHAVESSDLVYRGKGFWHDWLINHILLREALSLLEVQSGASAAVAAKAEDDLE